MDDKNIAWQEMWERYEDTDPEVRETVTALNLLGINTTASCEGHMTHGIAAAWVDVQVENTEDMANMNKKADELQESAEHLLNEMENDHHAHLLMAEFETVKDLILRQNLQETVDLSQLLEEFYQNRPVSFRVKLVINIYGRGIGRLISQGGIYQEAFDKEVQVEYMKEYQNEMIALGKWLRKKWLM